MCQPLGHTMLGEARSHQAKFLALTGPPLPGCSVLEGQQCPCGEKTGVLGFQSSSETWHLHPLGQIIQDTDSLSIKWGRNLDPAYTMGSLQGTHGDLCVRQLRNVQKCGRRGRTTLRSHRAFRTHGLHLPLYSLYSRGKTLPDV